MPDTAPTALEEIAAALMAGDLQEVRAVTDRAREAGDAGTAKLGEHAEDLALEGPWCPIDWDSFDTPAELADWMQDQWAAACEKAAWSVSA